MLAFAAVSQPQIEVRVTALKRLIDWWLFGQVPLSHTTGLLTGGHWTLVDARISRSRVSITHKFSYVLVQALLFPFSGDEAFVIDKQSLAFLTTARPDGTVEIARILHEEASVLCVRLRKSKLL